MLQGGRMFTLLRNAAVYAPERLGVQDVLLAGDRIAAIGPSLPSLPAALAPVELDLHGLSLVPGFVDSHVHVTGGGGESGPASRVPPIGLSLLTEAGVTTCVGTLGTDGTTRSVAELVARTLALREEGLSAYCYTGSYQLPLITLTGSVRSDIVFIDPVIGVGELAISDHRSSQPTFDEFLRIASDCHVAGLMSGKAGVLHLHLGDGRRGLDLVRRALAETELPARTYHPTHVNRNRPLFEEALAIAAQGVTIDVTAFPPDDDDPGLSATEALHRYLMTDLPRDRITCSSDGAGCMPILDDDKRIVAYGIGRPRELMVAVRGLLALGHPLEAILPAFTWNVAKQLRLEHKGRIAVGAHADVVVFTPDGHVRDVFARGQRVFADGRPTVLGKFESQKERQ